MRGLLEVLVFWFIVSAVVFGSMAAWLANERGRRPTPWILIGALAGPLAIVLAGLAPMRADNDRYKWCVECVEPVDVDGITCPHCGADQTRDDHDPE
jgi:hypothetical protein